MPVTTRVAFLPSVPETPYDVQIRGPNCQTVLRDFFDNNNVYTSTTQTFRPPLNHAYFINGIVQPSNATACPPPSTAHSYGSLIQAISFLLMAWKGVRRDEGIWYTTHDGNLDVWTPQENIPEIGTSVGSSLVSTT